MDEVYMLCFVGVDLNMIAGSCVQWMYTYALT